MPNTQKTHRDVIRRVLNREKSYLLSTYVRMIRKETGRVLNETSVVTTLRHMVSQGQVQFRIFGSRVDGSARSVHARKVVNVDTLMYDSYLT